MANDRKPSSLYCQKCRTPIDVDASIDQLNPAAFKLLTDSTLPAQQQAAKATPPRQSRQSRPTFPSARHQTYDSAIKSARNPTFKRNVPSSRFPKHGAHNPAMSFVNVHMSESMLDPPAPSPVSSRSPEPAAATEDTQSNGPEMTRRASVTGNSATPGGASMADGLETTNRMFEILSARSDIDHPICVECTELLVDGLQKRLGVATRERDAYVDYLRRANTDVPSNEEIKAAETSLKALKKSEVAAIATLEKLEAEKSELDTQLAALEVEARELDQTENVFWKNRNAFSSTLSGFQNERDALTTKHAHDAQILTHLQRRSVYNDAFNISHDNNFATINGLRLGRLPTPYVDWPEINAAWGQTCLLLATLAERLGYKFQGYELSPMGSTSTIHKLEIKGGSSTAETRNSTATNPAVTRQRLELYSSGDFPLNFGFLHRKFDTAMVAFIECLRQLGDFVENQGVHAGSGLGMGVGGGSVKMPYEIRKDKIHDQSIKLALNKEEAWTKACKYTLTCCKYLLAHVNNVESSSGRRTR
ncbi:autophagy protein Apg6-domain-containing protein [Massariosphaeria phaeospora]|uniref:Autophagy protein Apg6-domain-containing protein n=1 Tax=Massariosphaeria phaeospora TaxID=100035 RepID=A0A7C8IBZ1_9PLEO|nr:autophagy protein Apg6-domain-containing protein [Massariosphaeria phaeospora]